MTGVTSGAGVTVVRAGLALLCCTVVKESTLLAEDALVSGREEEGVQARSATVS